MWQTSLGRRIYSAKDGISVYDNYFFRWLTLGSPALQTVLNKLNLAKPVLYYIAPLISAAKLFPGRCCLLGLGGGGVIHALHPLLTANQLTAIEYNEKIITLAQQYFYISPAQATIIHAEANAYLECNQALFDHILVDLYGKHHFPLSCFHANFFANCQKSLAPEGILSVNIANLTEQFSIHQWLNQLFSGALLTIAVRNCHNMIIMASTKKRINQLIEQLKITKALQSLTWDSQWGLLAVFK